MLPRPLGIHVDSGGWTSGSHDSVASVLTTETPSLPKSYFNKYFTVKLVQT